MIRSVVLALLVLLVASACSPEEGALNFPPVETRYSITPERVECTGTTDERLEPADGPAMRHVCTWERVTVGGAPTCAATIVFAREDASSPWGVSAVFTSDASRCI